MDVNYWIKAESVSKKFSTNAKYSSINGMRDILSLMSNVKQDPLKLRRGEFWAVENISFHLNKNEIVGVIGKNGSGKSTPARILSQVYKIDHGKLKVTGKVVTLHSSITGMHPYLSGLENLKIKASLLGLSRSEIKSELDRVVEFSGLEQSIHRPFGTYSSGMRIRLGFSIITAVPKDILILDESLSVSDQQFNAQCLQYLLANKAKTSVIFISNILAHLEAFLDRAYVMEKGKIIIETKDVSFALNQFTELK